MKIKHGTTRTTFIFKRFVIKIPRIIFMIRLIKCNFALYVYSEQTKIINLGRKKQTKNFFQKAINSNKKEREISKKYVPNFFPKTYFSFFGLLVISAVVKGKGIGFRKLIPMFQELSKLDPYFQKNWEKGLYRGHDYYSSDWIMVSDKLILVDYGHGFGEFLAKNKEKVEAILKTEFEKVTI